eukprot:6209139-Pleurochrysis_carterae.AAC.1
MDHMYNQNSGPYISRQTLPPSAPPGSPSQRQQNGFSHSPHHQNGNTPSAPASRYPTYSQTGTGQRRVHNESNSSPSPSLARQGMYHMYNQPSHPPKLELPPSAARGSPPQPQHNILYPSPQNVTQPHTGGSHARVRYSDAGAKEEPLHNSNQMFSALRTDVYNPNSTMQHQHAQNY